MTDIQFLITAVQLTIVDKSERVDSCSKTAAQLTEQI